jgi:hypothetical protein
MFGTTWIVKLSDEEFIDGQAGAGTTVKAVYDWITYPEGKGPSWKEDPQMDPKHEDYDRICKAASRVVADHVWRLSRLVGPKPEGTSSPKEGA